MIYLIQESLKPDLEMERLARFPYTDMSQLNRDINIPRSRERGVMSIDVKKAISDENSAKISHL
jgi:hypothetical protein